VGAVPGPRAFDERWEPKPAACLHERAHVVSPCPLVEIGSEKPAGLVGHHGVDPHDVMALQVGENGGVIDGAERLVLALAALYLRQIAYASYELCSRTRAHSPAYPSCG
jgi:hypothetical protein